MISSRIRGKPASTLARGTALTALNLQLQRSLRHMCRDIPPGGNIHVRAEVASMVVSTMPRQCSARSNFASNSLPGLELEAIARALSLPAAINARTMRIQKSCSVLCQVVKHGENRRTCSSDMLSSTVISKSTISSSKRQPVRVLGNYPFRCDGVCLWCRFWVVWSRIRYCTLYVNMLQSAFMQSQLFRTILFLRLFALCVCVCV